MYAVKEPSRGLNAPAADHYLAGTGHFVQHLRPTVKIHDKHKALDINTYVDSDWAGCHDTRRSTSGVALFVLAVNLLSHSRAQATVALSSGEAELYAIGSGTSDSLFIRTLTLESGLFEKANLTVHTDSTAGKRMAGRFRTSRKTEHVDLRHLYMQELVTSGLLRLRKVPGTQNPADVMIKNISKDTLATHLPALGFFSRCVNFFEVVARPHFLPQFKFGK